MKKVIKIAWVELNILFYSPIAWLVLIIFSIQCGLSFSGILADKEASQQLGNALEGITTDVFTGRYGFFTSIQNNLFLYIPLLTMGLMSREISSGSLKLLLSSPLNNKQIILGKYLSVLLYSLCLMLILFLCVGMGGISIEAMDIGLVLSGMLGLYLLICAYAAIGIFLSSLTGYQVVAAVSTLAVLALLKFVGQVGQSIDFVREITYWISIDGRVDNFIGGIISSKDVGYFLLVIFLFLTLSIMYLDAGRVMRSPATKLIRYGGIIFTVLLLGYISSLPQCTAYYDATRFKERTLTKASQEIIQQIDAPVQLVSYVNVLNTYAHVGAPRFRNFERRQFEQFIRYLPDFKISYVPYYDTIMNGRKHQDVSLKEAAFKAATAYGYDFSLVRSPEEIKKNIDLLPEENRFVRMLHYKDKVTPLRMFDDMIAYPQEAEVSAALKRMLEGPAQVGVLSSNGERSIFKTGDKDYKNISNAVGSRYALINQGFDVQAIYLDSLKQIPALDVLVIADPKVAYSQGQLEKIRAFVNEGGNVLFAVEPRKQAILNPLTETFGVVLTDGMVLQKSKEYALDLVQTKPTPALPDLGMTLSGEKPVISLSSALALKWMGHSAFKMTPLLKSGTESWVKTGSFNIETDSLVYDSVKDKQGPFLMGLALTRVVGKDTQKIVIMGDADFMSNNELQRRNLQTRNTDFTVQLFRWFTDGKYPIDTSRPEPVDNRILAGKSLINGMKWSLAGVLPLLLALGGSALLIRRKRQ